MYDYYREESEKLRNIGKDLNLTDNDIDRIIDESFKFLEAEYARNEKSRIYSLLKKKNVLIFSAAIGILAFLCVFSSFQQKVFHGYVVRHFQILVYPAMKMLRKIMLPVIDKFPSLTELYDEACLLGNPYFQVSDIDCWPCENVKSIWNLTLANLSHEEYHSGIPFIYRDGNLKEISFNKLKKMYQNKKVVFDKDGGRMYNSSSLIRPSELFVKQPITSDRTAARHFAWKLNRLEPVRELRLRLGYPTRSPSYVAGITIEKWLLLDEPNSPPYNLQPWTEGSTVFVLQSSGSRLITLEPAPECASVCGRASILLPPRHILWYNWWYWRGKSLPVPASSQPSITYLGSFY